MTDPRKLLSNDPEMPADRPEGVIVLLVCQVPQIVVTSVLVTRIVVLLELHVSEIGLRSYRPGRRQRWNARVVIWREYTGKMSLGLVSQSERMSEDLDHSRWHGVVWHSLIEIYRLSVITFCRTHLGNMDDHSIMSSNQYFLSLASRASATRKQIFP